MSNNDADLKTIEDQIVAESSVDLKLEPLRDRGELEKAIAAQIAVGAITSLEEAERRGNIDALEYYAQGLFDDARSRVAGRRNLPLNIVMHLINDRVKEIRYKVLMNHWSIVPKDVFEDILAEAKVLYQQDKNYYPTGWENKLNNTFDNILSAYFHSENDGMVVRLLNIKGIRKGSIPYCMQGLEEKLINMPETCRYLINEDCLGRISIVNLIHPDEEIRKEAVEKVCKMNVDELRDCFHQYNQHARDRRTHIKTEVFKIISNDPSNKVRRILVNNTNWLPTLELLSNDGDALVRRKAMTKAATAKRRADYASKYHARKK